MSNKISVAANAISWKPRPSLLLGSQLSSLPFKISVHPSASSFSKIPSKHTSISASIYSILMAAAAAASSSKPKRNYDVFLSFRGTDVRNNFLGHLYTGLHQHGLFTYIDSEELRKGEQISPALINAIEESCVAIIIFSKDYASSPWCLEEVAKIMECKEQKDLMVFPVFYKVDPREVRTPRENYREAMAKHEIKFGKDSDEVKRWKKALFDAGSLSGWHFTDGDEAKLIKRIVEEISLQLDRTPLHVAKHPVGIHLPVVKLKSMLDLESDDDVLMIGLWGQGGIGKTTLAKALYNAIFRQFEGLCFLANVQEASRDSKDLVSVQKKLLSDILVGKVLAMTSVDEGINLMQYRLCRKKVLLILDDVNDLEQLNALAGDCEWFGKGSRIIITTRDSHLLTSHGIDEDHIYEVQTLENCEALELFNKHAFVRNNQIEIRRDLVDSALSYANGLPLALEVLGSFLHGRREHEWESALSKLAKSPNEKINKVLKLSYDGLEQNEKEIFLDIACFFKGRDKMDFMKVLDSCGFATSIGVQVLVEKSLIYRYGGTLHMHDLIQMMGMDIVKQECLDDPGKRSRLWLYDDVHYVLSGDMGTNAVKAIVLDLHEPKEICIGPDAFTNMKRLRLLIMINVHTSFQGPIGLPNELRWFEWPDCPWVPQFSSGPKKLVGLDLQRSNIQVVREQFKGLVNLKFLNLSECGSLVSTPDLSCAPNLEELHLHGCKNLERAHESVACHGKLWLLNLMGCSKLRRFPEIPDKNKSLRKLYLCETSIEELPASIGNLISLENMDLDKCKKLAIVPSSIYELQNLEYLSFSDCPNLTYFPEVEDLSDPHTKTGFPKLQVLNLDECNLSEVKFLKNPSCFPRLSDLDLSGNNFTKIPTCEKLYCLEFLGVSDCRQLQEIPNIPGNLECLVASNCESLSRIPSKICDVRNVGFQSCHELVRNGYSVIDWFKPEKFHHRKYGIILPGGEMPKWLIPNKEGYISFVASKGLYEKLLRVAWCVVLRAKEVGSCRLIVDGAVNGRRGGDYVTFPDLPNSDHVWLHLWEPKSLWRVDDFGANDLCHFHLILSLNHPNSRVTVKKCGFRLLCKPLENDLEVLPQDDQLLDPALLYEVGYEDCLTSSEEESSSETEDLLHSQTSTEEEDSSSELVRNGLNIADFSIEKHRYFRIDPEFRKIRPGGEMREEFVPVEDGTISFMASHDLYDEFIGLALCVVFGVADGKNEISFDIVPHVHGQRRNALSGTLGSFDSDHIWIQYLVPNALWGVLGGAVDFGQFEESCLQFSLTVRVSGGTVKKFGYMLRCRRLEGDLKVVLEENQLVNPASLFEESDSEDDTLPDSEDDTVRYPTDLDARCMRTRNQYMRRVRFCKELEGSDSETD